MSSAYPDDTRADSVTWRDSVLWRRIDGPGHDACRLVHDQHRWCLEGTAVFLHNQSPASLSYRVVGSSDWRPLKGSVKGFAGDIDIDLTIARSAGKWMLNGMLVAGLDDCEHLDFGFTPATNLPHLRWLDLRNQASASLPVAWLNVPFLTLTRLPQRYTRRTETAYWYEAPSEGFAAELLVSPSGFVRRYPGLWETDG